MTGETFEQAVDRLYKEAIRDHIGEVIVWFARAVAQWQAQRDAELCRLSADQIRLMCGEMKANEMRSVKAVLASRLEAILKDTGLS